MNLNKKSQEKTLGKLFGFLRENRLKNLKFSFSPEKKTYLYSKNCGKINIGEKNDRKRL